jgi:hypothetical protein
VDLPALEEGCRALEERVSGLEHGRIALLARLELARCALLGGHSPREVRAAVKAIRAEAEERRLAEPRQEAAGLEAELRAGP